MSLKDALGGITLAEAERNIADWCDRLVMSAHRPLDLGGKIICTNHWGKPKPAWPCPDYEAAATRTIERDQSSR